MDEDRQEQPGKDEGKKADQDASGAFEAYQAALKEQDEWLERMKKAKAKKGDAEK